MTAVVLKSSKSETWKAWGIAAFFLLAVLAAGFLSRPCLGDEISFYRMAKGFFYQHARIAIDPVYVKSGLIYYYNSEPLWPALLGGIWAVLGRESLAAAQIYHTFYFALLLFATYRVARHWFSEKHALLSLSVLASTPMIAAFSILFYAEIPMMALFMASLLLLIKKKALEASLIFCLAYLTKLSVVFFLPALLVFIWKKGTAIREKISSIAFFMLPLAVTAGADSFWRKTHLNISYLFAHAPEAASTPSAWQTLTNRLLLKDGVQRFVEYGQSGLWEYTSSSLLNLLDVARYFGVVSLSLVAVYFALRKVLQKEAREGSRFCLGLIASYLAGFLYMFSFSPDVRYLLPIAPFLAMLASAAALHFWKNSLAKILISILCFLQFAGAVVYVMKERRVSEEIQQGFKVIKETLSEEDLVLYPEYVLVEQTDRGMVWSHRFRDPMVQLFWNPDKTEVLRFLTSNHIRYLAIKKTRIYDDSQRRHFGGYPQSFVKELGLRPEFELLYENKELSLWKML